MSLEGCNRKHGATVEDKCRLEHEVMEARQVEGEELVSLREGWQGMRAGGSLIGVLADDHIRGDELRRDARVKQILAHGFRVHLRIVDRKVGAFIDELAPQIWMAADSRVSLLSFLKAKPKMAMRLLFTVW